MASLNWLFHTFCFITIFFYFFLLKPFPTLMTPDKTPKYEDVVVLC